MHLMQQKCLSASALAAYHYASREILGTEQASGNPKD